MNDININKLNSDYINRKNKIVNNSAIKNKSVNSNLVNKTSFDEVLNRIKDNSSVKFSKHASLRLESRNIKLTKAELEKLDSAFEKAKGKGIKDALILMDNKVFIANIKNKVIITAATNTEIKENVFTNIDGAVIV